MKRSGFGETTVEMVIHHPHRLYEGIDDRAPRETEPVFLEIFGERIALLACGGQSTIVRRQFKAKSETVSFSFNGILL
jgi:hypothetical protein